MVSIARTVVSMVGFYSQRQGSRDPAAELQLFDLALIGYRGVTSAGDLPHSLFDDFGAFLRSSATFS
jgi:hypothetical protein